MKHVGRMHIRDGSGSKWEKVSCSCGWSLRMNGARRDSFVRSWWAHIKVLGGKVPKTGERPGISNSAGVETPDGP